MGKKTKGIEYAEFVRQRGDGKTTTRTPKKRPAKKVSKETPKADAAAWPNTDPKTGRPKDDPQYPRNPELMTREENEVGMRMARAQMDEATATIEREKAQLREFLENMPGDKRQGAMEALKTVIGEKKPPRRLPRPIDSFPEFMTPEDVQEVLQISRATFFRLVGAGDIPGAFKIGKSWRIDREKLKTLMGR